MIDATMITLIKDDPVAHGVFDEPTETRRRVPCSVRTAYYSEVYQARAVGLRPELVFVLSSPAEYQDEQRIEYNGIEYKVIRTYRAGRMMELTVQRSNADVDDV